MRRSFHAFAALLLLVSPVILSAQGDVSPDLQQKITQKFALTKFTADKADIVTAGAVLVLQKDNLILNTASVPAPPVNTYKNGKFSIGFSDSISTDMTNKINHPSDAGPIAKKVLVSDQKVWLSKVAVSKDKLILTVVTDPYDDGRYQAQIKFQFPKNTTPTADELLKSIAEVFTVQAADATAQTAPAPAQQQAAAAAPAPAAPAMAAIPPPPPPADAPPPQPKTISLGQTKDQVVAIFGPPQKAVKLGKKEIVYYPDMKVTLVDGKVSDVQ